MAFDTIKLEIEGRRARLMLNRPEEGNSINIPMVEEIYQACCFIEDETEAEVVVLSGAGREFCTGIDLLDFPAGSLPDIYGFSKWERTCRALERLPAATIAAVQGDCAGGGLQLILACDIRVAAEDSRFHFHDVRMGFIPGMGTYRLAKFIGLGRARRMALTGRIVEAVEGERIGLVDHLGSSEALEEKIEKAIAEFGPLNIEAIELTRRLVDESFENSWEEFLGNFLAAQHRAIQTEVFQENIRKSHHSGSPRGKE